MISCVIFVFGALAEYAGVLLQVKIAAARQNGYTRRHSLKHLNTVEKGVLLVHRKLKLRNSTNYKKKVII